MDGKILTSRQYFKLLSLIYGVMLAAQAGTGTVFFLLRSTRANVMRNEARLASVSPYLVPFGVVLLLGIGWFVSGKSLKNIKISDPLSDKLRKYQSVLIARYAFFEASTLFALVTYFLTGQQLLLGIAGGLILLFLTQIPTKTRVFNEMPFSPLEEAELNNPNAKVTEIPVKD